MLDFGGVIFFQTGWNSTTQPVVRYPGALGLQNLALVRITMVILLKSPDLGVFCPKRFPVMSFYLDLAVFT